MLYLIHLSRPLSDRHTSQHYLGFTPNAVTLGERVRAHMQGRGARFTQVAVERGIQLNFVRLWAEGDRHLERQLKKRKNHKKLCPVCNPKLKEKQLCN